MNGTIHLPRSIITEAIASGLKMIEMLLSEPSTSYEECSSMIPCLRNLYACRARVWQDEDMSSIRIDAIFPKKTDEAFVKKLEGFFGVITVEDLLRAEEGSLDKALEGESRATREVVKAMYSGKFGRWKIIHSEPADNWH